MTKPPIQEITDPEALRLLAHPMRQRIEQRLRLGPANSTSLARDLGESTGTTSYHLRKLAEYGFVEEVPELAKGRERWWRQIPGDRRVPPYSRQSADMRQAVDELLRMEFADDLAQFARFQADRDRLSDWADVLALSRSSLRLNPARLKEFFEEYIKLLYRFKLPKGESPDDARTVLIRLLAFPLVDDPSDDEQVRDGESEDPP